MNFRQEILGLTKQAIESNNGELAYLSLTSKPEGPIRDRVSWLLQKKLDEEYKNLVSAREYSRYDLAILDIYKNLDKKEPKEVKHIFEFKVGSAASFRGDLQQADKFIKRVINDFQSGYENGENLDQMTSIFIAVEPLKIIRNNQRPFIKYAARSNMLRKKINQESQQDIFIHQKIADDFKSWNELKFIDSDYLEIGSFRDINVRLHLLILGANSNEFPVNLN